MDKNNQRSSHASSGYTLIRSFEDKSPWTAAHQEIETSLHFLLMIYGFSIDDFLTIFDCYIQKYFIWYTKQQYVNAFTLKIFGSIPGFNMQWKITSEFVMHLFFQMPAQKSTMYLSQKWNKSSLVSWKKFLM